MNRPNGLVVNFLAQWREKQDLISKSVQLKLIAIASPPTKSFTVYLGTRRGDGLCQLVKLKRYKTL